MPPRIRPVGRPPGTRVAGSRRDRQARIFPNTATSPGITRSGRGVGVTVRKKRGDLIPNNLADRRLWAKRAVLRLRRIVKRDRGTIWRGDYPVPLRGGGTPTDSGALLRSSFARANADGSVSFGWNLARAKRLDEGETLKRSRRFYVHKLGQYRTLPKGHKIRGRQMALETLAAWWRDERDRLIAFRRRQETARRTGRRVPTWRQYR